MRLLLLSAFFLLSCSPGLEIHTGEHKHCPSGAIEELKKSLTEMKQVCASFSAIRGDSENE